MLASPTPTRVSKAATNKPVTLLRANTQSVMSAVRAAKAAAPTAVFALLSVKLQPRASTEVRARPNTAPPCTVATLSRNEDVFSDNTSRESAHGTADYGGAV